MNVNILSNEELISYIEAGVVTSVTSDKVLEIIREFQEEIESLEETTKELKDEIWHLENKPCEFCDE